MNKKSANKSKRNTATTCPGGICIVCGSGRIVKTSYSPIHRDFVECDDCGSIVTLQMHERRQITAHYCQKCRFKP